MPETVRLVSDGEEIVLSDGEAYRIHSEPRALRSARERHGVSAPPKLALNYVGFQDVQDRREYALDARLGEQTRRYTVWIELAAFSKRQALLQEGPDICYQKLLHELAGSEMQRVESIGVTDVDLAAYRESHPVTARRGFSAPRPEPAKGRVTDQ